VVKETVRLVEIKGDKGDKGDRGEKGDQGIPGIQGIRGEKGDQGDRGEKGDKGDQGDRGEKGDYGGPPGPKGDRGEKGEKGDKGDQGIRGFDGDRGEKGEKGDKGDRGEKGEKGDKGDQGIRGETGEKGDKGDRGDQGIPGQRGDKGDKGDRGEKGDQGIQGIQGERGDRGEKGDRGDTGDRGEKGDKGDSPILTAQQPLVLKENQLSLDLNRLKRAIVPSFPMGGGGIGEAFKTVSVSGQTSMNAVQYENETLTFVEGAGIGMYANPSDNSLKIESLAVAGSTGAWGAFWDSTTQTNAGSTAANAMRLGNTDPNSNGVSVVSNSRVTVQRGGVYNFQFSAQFNKTDSGNDLVEIWFAKNGTNLPDSSTQITVVGNNGKMVPAWNYMLQMAAGEYIELYWHSNDLQMRILASTGQSDPPRPSIPSVILTVHQVPYAIGSGDIYGGTF
jgi:hypothetical protein